MFRRIYLDNSATTPVDPEVIAAMMPYLTENFGNPSSIHYFGQRARAAVDKARHQVAALINARPNEIVFTSGGTESNNLGIRGLLEAIWHKPDSRPQVSKGQLQKPDGEGELSTQRRQPSQYSQTTGAIDDASAPDYTLDHARASELRTRDGGDGLRVHLITSSIEHSSVKNVCEDLEKLGVRITYLPVHQNGLVRVEDLKSAVGEGTVLISVMTANNEIGTIQPVGEIGRFVKELRREGRKIYFHTDAVQAAGKMPVDVEEIGCDLLSISAHKIYAPKGIGALYVRRGIRLHPQNIGGHQERERRGGTESVANIVGFGKACELARERLAVDAERLWNLRLAFEQGVLERIENAVLNGDEQARLPNIANISFAGIEGEGLLINLDMRGIAVSTGSACSSGSLEPSPVIRALGRDDEMARGAIRFSLGRENTADEIKSTLEILPEAVENLRKLGRRQ